MRGDMGMKRLLIATVLLAAPASVLLAAPAAAQVKFHPAWEGAPFSESAEVNGVLYLSGQIGSRADRTLPDGMEAQARQAMDNIRAAVERRGLTMDHVFKCTVMMADMRQWGDFNKIYITYFKPGRLPARSAFGANGLAMGALLEVECMASLR